MPIDASWALIFGGCCSNVFALEAIVKHEPAAGLLITVVQFALATVLTLPTQLRPGSWRIKVPHIPLTRLITMSFMFFAVNMLNNWAFAFDISVPMHILLRSFGSVTTLTMGWLSGKCYSRVQVASVAALTVGVCVSAYADALQKGRIDSSSSSDPSSFAAGLAILFAAQLISAVMGVYTEATYAAHGRHWLETLFYSHALSLLFSVGFASTVTTQARRLAAGPRASVPVATLARFLPGSLLAHLERNNYIATWPWTPPAALLLLALNAVTQIACISGVNRLSSQTGAVTVTVVLNVRKLVSFLLSCALFGNEIGPLMSVGAVIVFGAGAVYGWDGSRRGKVVKGKKDS